MITGFRWSEAGAQGLYGVVPDLSTFGKALGNEFAVSALAGRRDLMERGGLRHSDDRVFLLSTTHGAETHSLAAAMAVQTTYVEEGVTARLHTLGERLAAGVREAAGRHGRRRPRRRPGPGQRPGLRHPRQRPPGVAEYAPCSCVRLLAGGVLAPSFVVSSALDDADVDHTVDVVAQACAVYRKALDAGDPTPSAGRTTREARIPPLGVR